MESRLAWLNLRPARRFESPSACCYLPPPNYARSLRPLPGEGFEMLGRDPAPRQAGGRLAVPEDLDALLDCSAPGAAHEDRVNRRPERAVARRIAGLIPPAVNVERPRRP